MRRVFSILVLAIFLLSIIPPISIVYAASRTIDGDPSDWTGTPPTTDNTGEYDTTAGEWIWKDAAGDERTDFASPDTRVDITEFRVSGNSTHLLLLVKFNDLDLVGGDGAPAVLITIDEDRTTGSGQTYFALNSDTQTASDGSANWEYQILIDLANSAVTDGSPVYGDGVQVWNGGSPLDVLDTSWSDVSTGNSVFVASTVNDVVEIAIAWSDLGITDVSDFYLRIELADVRSNGAGDAWDLSGVSDVLDCMTTTGPNTWDEVGDGYIDYYVDIHFVNGEPTPPPPPTYKVYGYVYDQNGNPVVGATVSLDGTSNTTNATGYYEIYVASGTYTLTASKPGYDTYTATVTVSGDMEYNITLWKLLVDTSTNNNDFPSGSLVYQAPQLLSATGNSENALQYLYVAWDEKYLYVGADWAPGTWGLAFGIGIDANPSVSDGYNNGTDSWGKSLNFTYAYIDYEAYFWYDGSSITSADYNNYSMSTGTWTYDFAPIYYGSVASGHDGSTVFKVAIPWSSINTTTNYNGTIVLAVWVTGGSGSAVSALPLNPDTLTAGDEWSDADNIYMYVSITVDQDIDGLPDTGVTADARTIFYPSLTTTLTTDKDVYNVITGGVVNIIATLTDELGYPLPSVEIYVTDGVTTLDTEYTDNSGQATLSFTAPSTPGTYTYTVVFDGHAGWASSTKTVTVVVSAPSYKVYGYVTDKETGSGVVDAEVELLDPDTLNPVVTNTTIANGYYELYTSPGTYILRVNKTDAGYALYTVKVTVAGDTRVDVELMKYLIDLTTNDNDFPANSFIYVAKDYLTAPRPANHNLSRIYVAWDTEYLYIGTDFAPGDWWVAFGFAIDVNPGNSSTGYGAVWDANDKAWEDCWRRKINFTTPYTIGPVYPELIGYIWYQGTDGITAAQINRYKYETYPPVINQSGVNHDTPWEYGYATPKYSPVATTKDGSTLFKVAIPWSAIQFLPNITYTGELAIVVWVAHGDTSSALSVLPNNPLVFDQQDWSEWGDNDVLYMTIKINYDSDLDYAVDDVPPSSVTTYYPSISTTVEVSQDYYELGAGQTFQVLAKVKDQLGNYLAAVKVEVYDQNGHKIAENLTAYNTGDMYAFTAAFTLTAPLTKGAYNYTIRFVGEAGFQASEKNITINVTKSGTRIVDLAYTLTIDNDGDGVPDSGDTITVSFRLEGYDGGWHGLANKPVSIVFNYTLNGVVETVDTSTDPYGYVSYSYIIASITGADKLVITARFDGDENYSATSSTVTAEVNLARVIDGSRNDWGTQYPRSTPGIAPRGDEIVITDPANDVHQGATDEYRELDIREVRITYDGLYLYFYVEFNSPLTRSDEFTVNVAVDATPDNPADGVGGGWLYGYWYTDMRLGGFTATNAHIDTWQWTHIIEAVPIENTVQVRALSDAVKNVGNLYVNTTGGFIEFRVPMSELPALDPAYGFRVWIVVFGVETRGSYLSLTGANAIDVAGVGDTNLELLTSRDPNWANLTWPGEDIWVDTGFLIKFSAPSTPDIPDPSPSTPPTDVDVVYIIYNGTLYKAEEFQYRAFQSIEVLVVVRVTGTQGRPIAVTIGGHTYYGVAGADDIGLIPARLPELVNGYLPLTASSDGSSDTVRIRAIFPPPLPEPPLSLILLALLLAYIVVIKRRK